MAPHTAKLVVFATAQVCHLGAEFLQMEQPNPLLITITDLPVPSVL